MNATWQNLKRDLAVDLVGLAGVALVVNGVRLVYAPAAWIIGGLALVAWALVKGRAVT